MNLQRIQIAALAAVAAAALAAPAGAPPGFAARAIPATAFLDEAAIAATVGSGSQTYEPVEFKDEAAIAAAIGGTHAGDQAVIAATIRGMALNQQLHALDPARDAHAVRQLDERGVGNATSSRWDAGCAGARMDIRFQVGNAPTGELGSTHAGGILAGIPEEDARECCADARRRRWPAARSSSTAAIRLTRSTSCTAATSPCPSARGSETPSCSRCCARARPSARSRCSTTRRPAARRSLHSRAARRSDPQARLRRAVRAASGRRRCPCPSLPCARRLSQLLVEALYEPADTRVLRRLLEFGEEGGVVPLTQEELSHLAGTSRATVNGPSATPRREASLRSAAGVSRPAAALSARELRQVERSGYNGAPEAERDENDSGLM